MCKKSIKLNIQKASNLHPYEIDTHIALPAIWVKLDDLDVLIDPKLKDSVMKSRTTLVELKCIISDKSYYVLKTDIKRYTACFALAVVGKGSRQLVSEEGNIYVDESIYLIDLDPNSFDIDFITEYFLADYNLESNSSRGFLIKQLFHILYKL